MLQQSAFAPPPPGALGLRAGLSISARLIQFQARFTWPKEKVEHETGGIYLTDKITTTLSTAGIRTTLTGHQEVDILPDVDFTATIDESLALQKPPGQDTPMTSQQTGSNVDADDLSEFLDEFIKALFDPTAIGVGVGVNPTVGEGIGLAGFISGVLGVSGSASGKDGVGGSIAKQWPAFELIGRVFDTRLAKIRFLWDNLMVDATNGVRTTGIWVLEARQPAVEIIGDRWVTIPEFGPRNPFQGNAAYYLRTTDLVVDQNAKIQWTGAEASQANPAAAIAKFGALGSYTITASVTDEDGFSATASFTTTVIDR
jgi:hypothetical protein